jgi:hypothetical protein
MWPDALQAEHGAMARFHADAALLPSGLLLKAANDRLVEQGLSDSISHLQFRVKACVPGTCPIGWLPRRTAEPALRRLQPHLSG